MPLYVKRAPRHTALALPALGYMPVRDMRPPSGTPAPEGHHGHREPPGAHREPPTMNSTTPASFGRESRTDPDTLPTSGTATDRHPQPLRHGDTPTTSGATTTPKLDTISNRHPDTLRHDEQQHHHQNRHHHHEEQHPRHIIIYIRTNEHPANHEKHQHRNQTSKTT